MSKMVYCLSSVQTVTKIMKKKFDEGVAKRREITYRICDESINKCCLVLRQDVYPYIYLNRWQTFKETSLADKKGFYGNLNVEDITDFDKHAKKYE